MREEDVNRFRETQEIFDKLFQCLFGAIALRPTSTGDALFKTHPNFIMVIVLMTELYFLLCLLGTMLRHRNVVFLMISLCLILLIGSFSSVLVAAFISLPVAWLTSLLWIGVFALTGRYCYQELYALFACSISDIIMKLIQSYYNSQRQGTGLPV